METQRVAGRVAGAGKFPKEASLMGGQRVAGRNLEETTPYGGPSCGGPTPAGVSTWQAQARKKQPVMGPQTLAGPMLFGTKQHSEEATRGRG